jgi:hypothetical protein
MHRELPTIIVIAISFLSALPIGANASPFTIDGSTVYVNGGFVGVRTSTPITVLDVNGDAQFGSGATKSTFTATGLLKLTSAGIQWADNSTSTTATSGSSGGASVQVSTYVFYQGGTQSQTSYTTCLTTVTATVANVPLIVWFAGSACYDTQNDVGFSFLVDGGYVSPLNATTGIQASSYDFGGRCRPVGFIHQIPAQGAGSHSVCLTTLEAGGGTATISGTAQKVTYGNVTYTASQFGFKEAH